MFKLFENLPLVYVAVLDVTMICLVIIIIVLLRDPAGVNCPSYQL